ncbi:hypothetical protein [Candidatus Odyssella acanthamoebae]|uniref:Uncharacterized protein n=1 Tax=Candidatus Odyssella acanthamoebae TaxID=91604 RepID=A0A077ART0_9PROT|nr:hypothetical protein [Candidatus Paracaedibacter acanthamoebae]AIK95897.1 hypothetical protein ID47_02830 [Candidatus Paracaedibacter acanthamoebae]
MKLIINHEDIKMTPYEFDKTLMKMVDTDLFFRNENGTVRGLNHDVYARAALSLLETIYAGDSNE